MKRYDFWDDESGQPSLPEPEEHGRFVYFQEAQAEIETLRGRIDKLIGDKLELSNTIVLLRDELTATTLQRDNAIRDAREHYGNLVDARTRLKMLELST